MRRLAQGATTALRVIATEHIGLPPLSGESGEVHPLTLRSLAMSHTATSWVHFPFLATKRPMNQQTSRLKYAPTDSTSGASHFGPNSASKAHGIANPKAIDIKSMLSRVAVT